MKPATLHYEPTTPAGKPRDKPYIVTRRGRVIGRFATRIEADRLVRSFASGARPGTRRPSSTLSRRRPFGSKPVKGKRR